MKSKVKGYAFLCAIVIGVSYFLYNNGILTKLNIKPRDQQLSHEATELPHEAKQLPNEAKQLPNEAKQQLPREAKQLPQKQEQPPHKASKRIHYYNKPTWIRPDTFKNCDHSCFFTWGEKSYNDSDVVVFHAPYMTASTIPPKKMPGQIWVLHNREPQAYHYTKFTKWKWLFNWTVTFQRDSDSPALTGMFIQKSEIKKHSKLLWLDHPFKRDPGNYNPEVNWASKENRAAWFVSNCNAKSKRDEFTKALSNHIDVDIFGECGKLKCPRKNESACLSMLHEKYKIYLAFENSFCRDHVSRKPIKLFRLLSNAIPVTRGVDDQYSLFLPPGSFINTINFTSIKQLGEHIKQVMESKELFTGHFKWMKHYIVDWNFPREFCGICRKLHEGPEKHKRIYENVGYFLNGETYKPYCHEANDLPNKSV